MEIGAAEAASALGVSPRRVQALLAGGRLTGRRVGRTWLVDEEQLGRVARRSRPLSAPMAGGLLAVLSGARSGLDARSRARLQQLVDELLADPDPADRLASWVPHPPADVHTFSVAPEDVPGLRADDRVVPTGISDLRSGLATSHELEARVREDDLPGVVRDHLLSRVGRPNVRLLPGPDVSGPQVPFGVFLVDLSAHSGPREAAAVHHLIQGLHLPGAAI